MNQRQLILSTVLVAAFGGACFSSDANGATVILPDPNITFTNGKDTVTGDGDTFGIRIDGDINTLGGNDALTGTGTASASKGIWILATLDTGSGNDTITGTGTGTESPSNGIFLDSTALLDTGNDNDTITGTAEDAGTGIFLNAGSPGIKTGAGNDEVIGKSDSGTGIDVNSSALETGNGNDIILGTGTTGVKLVTGGTIKTGNGSDTIIGNGIGGALSSGIQNFGTIETGAGNDTVDARNGGFSGDGITNLGNGDDDLRGFGTGHFEGGNGKDTLELTSGTYTVSISDSEVSFRSGAPVARVMSTTEFETLIAGNARFDFADLSGGQVIFIP